MMGGGRLAASSMWLLLMAGLPWTLMEARAKLAL